MKNGFVARCEVGILASTLMLLSMLKIGCGATCNRIEADRKQFWDRKGDGKGPHLEMTVPFSVAERLVKPYIATVKPINIAIPGLGNLADYFGEISVVPTKVKLIPAAKERIGFHLDFEVQRNEERVFDLYIETEVKPEIDLAARKIVIGFTPESLQNARPGISDDGKGALADLIYAQIPGPARLLISKGMVDGIAGSAVEMLLDGFFDHAKEKMLPKMSAMSRFEVALPNLPLTAVSIASTDKGGGVLTMAMTTSLPIRDKLASLKSDAKAPSKNRISLRMSGSAAAELVNFAITRGLIPDRYNEKGKPKKEGSYRPGLDWIRGDKRPMKVFLWDLEKPCMKISMSAKPSIELVGDSIEVKAEDVHTDDVDASAFTKIGVWFYVMWKDAVNFKKKSSSKLHLTAAGQEIDVFVKQAAVEQDEIFVEAALMIKGKSK